MFLACYTFFTSWKMFDKTIFHSQKKAAKEVDLPKNVEKEVAVQKKSDVEKVELQEKTAKQASRQKKAVKDVDLKNKPSMEVDSAKNDDRKNKTNPRKVIRISLDYIVMN